MTTATLAMCVANVSVRVSYGEKEKKGAGKGAQNSSQGTRVDLSAPVAAWSLSCMTHSLTLAGANVFMDDFDPRSHASPTARALLHAKSGTATVVATTARNFASTFSPLLTSTSVVDRLRALVADTGRRRALEGIAPPDARESVRKLCARLCPTARPSGTNIWEAMVLARYLSLTVHGRRMAKEAGVTLFDVAVADALLKYAMYEVTRREERRARQAKAVMAGNAAKRRRLDGVVGGVESHRLSSAVSESTASAAAGDDDDGEEEDEDEDDEWYGQDLAERHKRRRSGSKETYASHFIKRCVRMLEGSDVHVLLVLLSSSSEAAHYASIAAVTTQLHDTNGEITQLASENARRCSESVSALIQKSPREVPAVVTWALDGVRRQRVVRSAAETTTTALLVGRVGPDAATRACERVLWTPAVVLCGEGAARRAEDEAAATGTTKTLVRPHLTETVVNVDRARAAGRHSLAATLEGSLGQRAFVPTTSSETGVARAVLVRGVRAVVSKAALRRGLELGCNLATAQPARAARSAPAARREKLEPDLRPEAKVSELPLTMETVTEVSCGNCVSAFLRANEALRNTYNEHPHKCERGKSPCRVNCCIDPDTGTSGRAPYRLPEHRRPQDQLVAVDLELELLTTPEEARRYLASGDRHALPPHSEPLETRADLCHVELVAKVTVAGSSPVRVPEAAAALFAAPRVLDEGEEEDALTRRRVREARALLLVGASQACLVGDRTTQACAPQTFVEAASAKKNEVPDNTHYTNATVNDTYRVGHRKSEELCADSAWRGTYGAGVETGVCGGLGRSCSALLGDNRGSALLMSDDVVESVTRAVWEKGGLVVVGEGVYDLRPKLARGIPYKLQPGVHRGLDDFADAMERARDVFGIVDQTADSVQCLPFTPYAERFCPVVTSSHTDERTRAHVEFCPTAPTTGAGMGALVDATVPETSLFPPDLVPPVQSGTVHDNALRSTHEHASVFLQAAALLGAYARVFFAADGDAETARAHGTTQRRVALCRMRAACHRFHEAPSPTFAASSASPCLDPLPAQRDDLERALARELEEGAEGRRRAMEMALVVPDVMVLLNVLYPPWATVGKRCVMGVYACAVEAAHWDAASAVSGLPCSETAKKNARTFWGRMARPSNGGWGAVEDLVCQLLRNDDGARRQTLEERASGLADVGGAVTIASLRRTRECLGRAIRNAWNVASNAANGTPPPSHPLAAAASADEVTADDVTPIYVARVLNDTLAGTHRACDAAALLKAHDGETIVYATGAAIGLKPSGFRQILTLMLAAPTVGGPVQYCRNEGPLVTRPSGDAFVQSKSGDWRSSKSTHPLSLETDKDDCGSLRERVITSVAQRVAYYDNVELLKRASTELSAPRSEEYRLRASAESVDAFKTEAHAGLVSGLATAHEAEARALLGHAVAEAEAECARACAA
jgi:hypothetical protein